MTLDEYIKQKEAKRAELLAKLGLPTETPKEEEKAPENATKTATSDNKGGKRYVNVADVFNVVTVASRGRGRARREAGSPRGRGGRSGRGRGGRNRDDRRGFDATKVDDVAFPTLSAAK